MTTIKIQISSSETISTEKTLDMLGTVRPTLRITAVPSKNNKCLISLAVHTDCSCPNVRKYYYYYRYSALGPVRAETRAQSGDWYGSGMLHPGQILRGSLPLLSPDANIRNYNFTRF
jgi:hypothetical protein